MKIKYQKIKPKAGDSLLNNNGNGWKLVGKITEVENSGIVHFIKPCGKLDVFIWIFQSGTPQEHCNNAFKWCKLCSKTDWSKQLSDIHPNDLIQALHTHGLAHIGKYADESIVAKSLSEKIKQTTNKPNERQQYENINQNARSIM